MKGTCCIIQPHYIPYKGYFDLFEKSEKVIILDDAQFVKREWKNRNKIRKNPTENFFKWLTVPVYKEDQKKKICDVRISDHDNEWRKYHINSLTFSYKKTKNFEKYGKLFFEIISDKKNKKLIDINMKIIKLICKILNIKKKFYFSSDLKLTEKGVKKLITICKIYKCDNYLANNKTVENYGVKEFSDNRINVLKQNFFEDRYTQEYDNKKLEWLGKLSILDFIFNCKEI